MSTGDELKAAVSARRDLGPDYEDAVVDSFLDKVGQEVDRRVDERLAARSPKNVARQGPSESQRLALAIVSLSLGTLATLVLVLADSAKATMLIPIWVGIIIVNGLFNGPRGKG
ncbi:hypothetical protein ABZ897_02480 [Nonomuraea sp. NPDC046802]|uniref:hypothetical protein n=1 Tax=Nonomuraea sp. NPDC046802 TaxID=3154919 RepID=UPI0033D27864